jgi:hypothetical protein
MPQAYPVTVSGDLIVRSGNALRALPNTTIQLVRTGTTTPAVIYSNDTFTVANTTGTVTSNADCKYSALTDGAYTYDILYKGHRYAAPAPVEDRRENTADIDTHAALTNVHVPDGETVASQEYVDDALAGVTTPNTIHSVTTTPSGGLGINGDYALDITHGNLYGPKASGAWPPPFSLVGPAGANGSAGGLATTTPSPLGTAAPGTATLGSKADHVHAMPTAAQVGAPVVASTAPANLAASASIGVSTTAARSDHVHSTSGLLSSTTPASLANTASIGVGTTAARSDHVHDNSGLVRSTSVGVANGVASLDSSGDVPVAQLPATVLRNDVTIDCGRQSIYRYKQPVTTVIGTTYTVTAADIGTLLRCTSTSAVTVTVPNDGLIGEGFDVLQASTGRVTVSPGTGATVSEPDSFFTTEKQGCRMFAQVTRNDTGTAANWAIDGRTAV